MRRFTLLSLLLTIGTSLASQDPTPHWTLEEIAPDVFAATQPADNRFNDANVVFIVNEHDVVVVDAPADAARLGELIDEIGKRTDKPVRFVVNTHWHGDHTQGNALYRERWGREVTFVGHETLLEDVPGRAAADVAERLERYGKQIPEAEAQLAKGLGLSGQQLSEEEQERQRASIERAKRWIEKNQHVEFLVPTLTYRDRLILDRDGRRIELRHYKAHTRGDTVVYLPAERVLITGDLLDDLPYGGHGFPAAWIDALDELGSLDVEWIVPGHGPVFRGTEQLQAVKNFLEDLVGQVGAGSARSLDEVKAAVDVVGWREKLGRDAAGERFFDQVLGELVERAYREAQGETLD